MEGYSKNEILSAEKQAKNYVNDAEVEERWAFTAFTYAETHEKMLENTPNAKELKLTPIDEDMYSAFRKNFPNMDIGIVNEDEMKNEEGKKLWRPLIMSFEKKVKDYNMGTLMRLNVKEGYTQENSCIVPRAQFYCIEVARNKEGLNNNA
eukprot:GCRY01003123.1.p1 GENE.GCRY01003123.1~~GCRY01003123.1.p1  ORF type:complete len:150 (-),score=33.31 GCRY01003123.1:79-528(-)